MGQGLHGSARTTAAIRRTIQHSQESLQSLATRYSVNSKTVAKWRKRPTVQDARMGPEPASMVLTAEQQAIAMAFRQHTLLPLDDCLYALLVCAAGHNPAALPLGPAPLFSAPRHQPPAPKRRWAKPAEEEIQRLSYRLLARGLCRSADGRRQVSACSKLIVQSERHAELAEASLPLCQGRSTKR